MPPITLITAVSLIDQVKELTAKSFGLSVVDLEGDYRGSDYCDARCMAMKLVSENSSLSDKAIGKLFGGRDRTTVIHSLKKFHARHDTEAWFRAKYYALAKQVFQLLYPVSN